ncbi:MAG: family 2 encapsulin nanocompartment cargo protein terpene cyclase [Blastocatellia bacterium]
MKSGLAHEIIASGPTGLGTSAAQIIKELKTGCCQATDAHSRKVVTPPRGKPADLGNSASEVAAGRSSSAVTIPPLYCPDPVRIDEGLGEEVNNRLLAWVEKIGIFAGQLDHVRACNYGRYAMLIHPDTDDPDRLLLAAQCMAALFAVDDHYCDDERTGSDSALIGRRLGLAQSALDPVYIIDEEYAAEFNDAMKKDPVRVGLSAYIDRVAEYGTPAQVDRVRLATVTMFIPMNWEAGWRVTEGLPPVWEYLAVRQANSFGPCMTLIDIIGGYEAPGAIYSLPAVRRATMIAGTASIILNDIYSMTKESEPGIGDGGLPIIIAAERDCSLQEGVDRTAVIHDDLVREFEAAQRQLTATVPSPELWRYLAGLHAWLGGSREWHSKSGRYNITSV